MAQTAAIVDKLLTNVSSAIQPEGYISEMLLPQVKVKQSTGKLAKYGNQHMRIANSVMAGEGKARRVKPVIRTTDSYEIDDHGLESIVTKRDRDNVEKPYDAERDEVFALTNILWAEKERGLALTLADTGILTQNTTLSGTDQYSDFANSDPVGDFKTARVAVRDGSSLPPNLAWMDWGTAECLRFHPGLLDSLGFKESRPGGLTDDELAKALKVPRVLIAKAMFENSQEGQAESLSPIWGKHVWFGYMPASPQKYQVSLGYHLTISGERPRQVFKFKVNNPPMATGIIVTDNYDYFLSNVKAAYLIKDAVA